MARELVTIRVIKPDYERYRLWCGLSNNQLAEGLGVLLDGCQVPSLEEMRNFNQQFAPKNIRRLEL